MFNELTLFKTSASMARHAGQAQAIAARNIANADTPGYRAQRVGSFADSLRNGPGAMAVSRDGHIGPGNSQSRIPMSEHGYRDPNGNSVSLEAEMVASANASRSHEKAVAIYRHGLTVLRATLGSR